ncbi:hypothetical protein M5K25_001707 [Dendrobium thyrsiflorum]|uniref:Uncharacterized protein n=1 Tax=Dendrobium thyrsiflorum TaxID=117978 RepID=A0ABD0W0S2_DENTH
MVPVGVINSNTGGTECLNINDKTRLSGMVILESIWSLGIRKVVLLGILSRTHVDKHFKVEVGWACVLPLSTAYYIHELHMKDQPLQQWLLYVILNYCAEGPTEW